MRAVVVLLACLGLGAGWAQGFLEVASPRARVLYLDPTLGDFAQRVAHDAERALDVLEPLFGQSAVPVTLRLRDDTDVYNAFASPLPRPYVDLRALFPVAGALGHAAHDPLYLLVLHELTHIAHLGYTATPDGPGGGLGLGLVGDGVARVPPMWLLEGLAVWLESEHAAGGRRSDPYTLAVLRTLALDDDAWPSLAEAGLGRYDAWPGGMTRYLLGVGFTEHLMGRVGFEGVLLALRHYNALGVLGTFSDAWHGAHGAELAAEWALWREAVRAEAEALARGLEALEPLTRSGWLTGGAALGPDGETLAWVGTPASIRVGRLTEDGTLEGERTLLRDRRPERLSFLDDRTLLYSRTVRRPGSQYLELFTLDTETGVETQLTEGARAHLPAPTPEGCVLYLRDTASSGSSLMRWCDGEAKEPWRAPPDWHLVGLDVSALGQVALAVWRQGRVDLALLEEGELRWLTQDGAQNLEPRFQNEDALLFSSDRTGGFESYRLQLRSGRTERLTRTLGGAREPLAVGERLLIQALGSAGHDLALTPLEPQSAQTPEPSAARFAPVAGPAPFPVRPYSPWPSLAPYGWLPAAADASLSPLGLSLGATLLGQDASNAHAYALSLGYAAAQGGPLGGLHASASYSYRANTVLTTLVPPHHLSFGVRLGLWPHQGASTPEIAGGAQVSVGLTWPLDLWTLYGVAEAGLLHLGGSWQPDARAALTLSQQRRDDWSYVTRGTRLAATARVAATPSGPLPGLWASAVHHLPLELGTLSGTAELELRGGYRPPPSVPQASAGWAAFGTLGYRLSLDTPLRYGDGLYALERLTLEPRLRLWLNGGFGAGADLSLYADTLLNYAAPLSFGVTLGYANGVWYGLGLRLPL